MTLAPRAEVRPGNGAFPYRDRVEDLRRVLVQQGSLGLLLIDTSALAQIEHQYGSSAFAKVMAMARDLVFELQGTEVRHDREEKPGISNLIEIYSAVTGRPIAAIEKEFAGQQYGVFKVAVADAVVEFLAPVRERYEALMADPGEVDRRLAAGAEIAEAKAETVLARAMKVSGLVPRAGR